MDYHFRAFAPGDGKETFWVRANSDPTIGTAANMFLGGNFGIRSANLARWAQMSAIEGPNTAIGFGDSTDIHIASNAYFDGTAAGSWKYKVAGPAADVFLYNGKHTWRVANTGAANAPFTWTDAMTLDNSGRLGIGTTLPGQKLTVAGTIESTTGGVKFPDGTVQATAFAAAANGTLPVASKLGVGPGVTDAQATLQVAGDVRLGSNAAGGFTDLRIFTETNPDSGTVQTNTVVPVSAPSTGRNHTALHFRNATSGSGTNQLDLVVDGDVTVNGNVTSKFQDVAEWVSAETPLDTATVVVLDPTHEDRVTASTHAYDTAVAGVVSARPGLILGVADAGKEKIATTGRVKVKVDATRAPIAIGDLLVTSDIPGTAMRSEPIEINGRKFHQPGTVIGKALQSLPSGKGEILVLLSLQ